MYIILLVVLVLFFIGATIGYRRGYRQLDRGMLWLIVVPVAASALAVLISDWKSGFELAGLIGALVAAALCCVATGLILGAGTGWFARRAHGRPTTPITSRENLVAQVVVFGLSALGLILSLLE